MLLNVFSTKTRTVAFQILYAFTIDDLCLYVLVKTIVRFRFNQTTI